jgi:hypothetical protein
MSRVIVALVCVAFTTACGTSNGLSQSAPSGAGVGSGGDAGGDAGGHCACGSKEVCCLGEGLTCVAPGSCQGIPIVESCSAEDCGDSGVCCSTFLGPDGTPIDPSAFDGGLGHAVARPSATRSFSRPKPACGERRQLSGLCSDD